MLTLVTLASLSATAMTSELCSLVEVGTSKDYNDVVKLGVLQKKFDTQGVSSKADLFYVPKEKEALSFFIQTPVALHAPFAKANMQ